MVAEIDCALGRDESRLRQPRPTQRVIEDILVKFSICAPEHLIIDNRCGNALVRKRKAVRFDLIVKRGFRDQLTQYLAIESEGICLFSRNLPAKTLGKTLQFVLKRGAVGERVDFRRTHFRHG